MAEILDPRTRQLVNLAKLSDYVMSNEMVSAALAMSESRDVNAILHEILSSEGSEIYVRLASEYITALPRKLSFWEVMVEVRLQQVVLLGYLPTTAAGSGGEATSPRQNAGGGTGVGEDDADETVPALPIPVLNPRDKAAAREWTAGDRLVIISEY